MKRREKKKKLGFVGFFSRPFETSRPFSPPAVLFLHPQKKQHGKNAHAPLFLKTCFYSSYYLNNDFYRPVRAKFETKKKL
jgi:hypothetical protein